MSTRLILLLGLLGLMTEATRPKAAFIFGGYTEPADAIVDEAELFGCGSSSSINVATAPYAGYLSAGMYVPPTDGDGPGSVIACGGYIMEPGTQNFFLTAECMEFFPETNSWEKNTVPDMLRPRYAHFMDAIFNVNDTSDGNKYLGVFGYHYEAEIFNLDGNGQWQDLMKGETRFFSTDCMTYNANDGYYYSVYQNVKRLDPRTGESVIIGEAPGELDRPGRCAIADIDGKDVIVTRDGFGFDLELREWIPLQTPPNHPLGYQANAMFSFNDKPTVFGNSVCDVNGVCEYTQVNQYEPNSDSWINMGKMNVGRRFHSVVEVPAEFCDYFEGSETSTTKPDTKPPFVEPLLNSAALLIGGSSETEGEIIKSVEIFGCDDFSPGQSVLIEDYPMATYLSGSTYDFDIFGEGQIISCGGFQCDEEKYCGIASSCVTLRASEKQWVETAPLQSPRYAHFMDMMPNYNESKSFFAKRYPTVYGYETTSEILLEDSWTNLRTESDRIFSLDCVAYDQIRDLRYEIMSDVRVVDLWSGNVTILDDDLPEALYRPGNCALTFNGQSSGIMTNLGFWFNLDTLTWETKQAPPVHPWASGSGVIKSFRGRPTVFGQAACTVDGTCDAKVVMQYDPFGDQWIKLGEMAVSRMYFDYVQVPRIFCKRWFG